MLFRSSHAFSLRGKEPPEGYSDWPEFDAQVFGGNYHGHLGNSLKSMVQVDRNSVHPFLWEKPEKPFEQGYSLYNVMPLAKGTTVLATGTADGHPTEPVAWTFHRPDGGYSFYTSLGHPKDFANPHFRRLLGAGIGWTCGVFPISIGPSIDNNKNSARTPFDYWQTISVPSTKPLAKHKDVPDGYSAWMRCVIRVPREWKSEKLSVTFGNGKSVEAVYLNGQPGKQNAGESSVTLPSKA